MTTYLPLAKIAAGGMATVHVGAAVGAHGFRQLVALKRPHSHLADDAGYRAAFLTEAHIAARIHHANVVDVRDVVEDDTGLLLVMDYVEGASLADLVRSWIFEPPPCYAAVAVRVVLDACEGLRAVHELCDEDGRPLGLVHRDVSPANVLVGLDGVARIADFGLAKPLLAAERTTSEGALRGKLGYMAPEYVQGKKTIDQRIDVFAMGVVLWEALARKRLFRGENEADTLRKIQALDPPRLAELGHAGPDFDALVARALAKDPQVRFPSVAALAIDLARLAKEHDLVATHADVQAAFPPNLRATLATRRTAVRTALDAQAAEAPAEGTASARGTRSRRARVTPARVVLALAALAAGASVASASRRELTSRRSPHDVSWSLSPRVVVSRGRAPTPAPVAEPASTAAASARATPTKWPRPNPYSR